MSLRITLRYEIPGFAFIGLIFLLIWEPLVEKFVAFDIPSSVLAAFVAFVSGPTFGFLITQLWYQIFDKYFNWERKIDEEPLKTLVSYGVVKDADKASVALNYLYYKYEKRPVMTFLLRRVNLYHAICSTFLALSMGFCFGYLIRWAFGATFPVFRCFRVWEWWDYIHLMTWFFLGIMLFILCQRQKSVRKDMLEIQLFVVRKLKDKISELPKEYRDSSLSG